MAQARAATGHDGPDFPHDATGRVPTALGRSFAGQPDIPAGPTLDAARRAAAALPFRLALVSDGESWDGTTAPHGPLLLHGRFRAGLPVFILSATTDAVCPAHTGTARTVENVYGTAFAATGLDLPRPCPADFRPLLAVVGGRRPDYRRLALQPVSDPAVAARLQQLVGDSPEIMLPADNPAATGPGGPRLPLARLERLPGPGQPAYVLTYGGLSREQPATLVVVRNGRPHQFWLGCGVTPVFFRLGSRPFLAFGYQDCDTGRRGVYVHRLDGQAPLPVCVNLDFSG